MYDWRIPCYRLALEFSNNEGLMLRPEEFGHLEHFHYGGAELCGTWRDDLEIGTNDLLLDVGAGVGGTGRYFQNECRYVGIEKRSDFVEWSKQISPAVDLVLGDAELELPFDQLTQNVRSRSRRCRFRRCRMSMHFLSA